MNDTQPTPKALDMRYTIARLEPLQLLLSELKQNMELMPAHASDKALKNAVCNFIKNIQECYEKIQAHMIKLMEQFPVTAPFQKPETSVPNAIKCPLECASQYESKIIKLFRIVLNDYRVIKDVRDTIRTQFNEILYAFLKIKMQGNASVKTFRTGQQLF